MSRDSRFGDLVVRCAMGAQKGAHPFEGLGPVGRRRAPEVTAARPSNSGLAERDMRVRMALGRGAGPLEHRGNLLADGHLDSVGRGQLEQRSRRLHALGHHAHLRR